LRKAGYTEKKLLRLQICVILRRRAPVRRVSKLVVRHSLALPRPKKLHQSVWCGTGQGRSGVLEAPRAVAPRSLRSREAPYSYLKNTAVFTNNGHSSCDLF